jgi:hypothetical protein
MTFIVAILARWGVPERFRRALAMLVAAGLAIALLAALWGLWLRSHDEGVVERHETAITTKVQKRTEAADLAAEQADQVRAEQRAADSAATRKAIDDAEHQDPVETRAAAGPAARAAAESLRRRSTAGRD